MVQGPVIVSVCVYDAHSGLLGVCLQFVGLRIALTLPFQRNNATLLIRSEDVVHKLPDVST